MVGFSGFNEQGTIFKNEHTKFKKYLSSEFMLK